MSNNQNIETARKKVHKMCGEDLASKASDEFCLAFEHIPEISDYVGFTEAVTAVHTYPTVLEFVSSKENLKQQNKEFEKEFSQKFWNDLKESFQKLSNNSEYIISLSEAFRQHQIKTVRDGFYKECSDITNEIDRKTRGIAAMDSQFTSLSTEICWLNKSLKVLADPRLLGEIAADSKIERIDLTHRITKEINTSTKKICAPEFRKKFNGSGKGIIVAVIDSEIAAHHPAFQNRIVQKQNFTNEPWGNPDPHGTAVAGILASQNEDFCGVAPEVTVYNYKVLTTTNFMNTDDVRATMAIQQALEDGAHIANCSWGAGLVRNTKSRAAKACDTAWDLGLIIVKSAGNKGPNSQTLTIPAEADGIIVVGATDSKGNEVQDYSSRGPGINNKECPHLVAPGGSKTSGIFSCMINGGFGDCGYGTSYAAPHISGMLALLLEQNIDSSPDDLRNKLMESCELFDLIDQNSQGKGLVSFAKMV